MNGLQGTLDAYLVEGATDAKNEALDVVAEAVPSFEQCRMMRAIGRCAPGEIVTANSLRSEMDDALIANKSRAPMMRKACRDGLLEPVLDVFDGVKVHRSIPSTGASANGAHIKVYRRTSAACSPRQSLVTA